MAASNGDGDIVLDVKDLRTYFVTKWGVVKAVDGVDFNLRRGETLGIVGESGCGKSVTMLSIMRLVPSPPGHIVGGQILLEGEDILQIDEREMEHVRGGQIALLLQDPMTALMSSFGILGFSARSLAVWNAAASLNSLNFRHSRNRYDFFIRDPRSVAKPGSIP